MNSKCSSVLETKKNATNFVKNYFCKNTFFEDSEFNRNTASRILKHLEIKGNEDLSVTRYEVTSGVIKLFS